METTFTTAGLACISSDCVSVVQLTTDGLPGPTTQTGCGGSKVRLLTHSHVTFCPGMSSLIRMSGLKSPVNVK